jgi:hypothetical protein
MKSIGESLFEMNRSGAPIPVSALQRVNAKGLGLQESWFRDAIFAEPELVIGPCRTAGRVDADEIWLPWRVEVNFGSGPIDVLLVSSHGRIGIVETKLSYNPQKRREVVAQVLDYALSLQESDREDLPELPNSPHAPLEEDLAECLNSGRFLLIIAGDALDPRALRLSQSMLARHLTSEWDLAMVDLNVYRRQQQENELLVVPELLGTVQAELRQVVRVVVQGESVKARVVVDKIVLDEARSGPGAVVASVDDFLAQVQRQVPAQLDVARRIIDRMQQIAARSGGVVTFGVRTTSANLYYASSSGPRRFLSLRADGRLRLVLAYLRTAGLEEIIDTLVAAAAPAFNIGRNDRAGGIRYVPTQEERIFGLLARVEQALKTMEVRE